MCMYLSPNPKILMIDKLTRGIDIGAKEEIYILMKKLKEADCGIIMIPSESSEATRKGERIIVR